jgi:hypothetical protein
VLAAPLLLLVGLDELQPANHTNKVQSKSPLIALVIVMVLPSSSDL